MKAMREAGDRTTWTEPDEDWDDIPAVECPVAIREGRVVKRSGEFLKPGFWIEDEETELTG